MKTAMQDKRRETSVESRNNDRLLALRLPPSAFQHSLWTLVAGLVATLCMPSTSCAENVLDQVNQQRKRRGLYSLLPDPELQAAAEESSRRQAARHRMGHTGTMPMGTAEGVGRGRVGPNGFRFRTCYHSPGNYTTSHRYAGAAIVGGYATLSLDSDKKHGAIGSGRSSTQTSNARRRGNTRRRSSRRR